MPQGNQPPVAVVGAGAIAESEHLPVLRALKRPTVVVDPNLERARALAAKFHAVGAEANHKGLAGRAAAAIVSAPHRLHAPIAIDLLGQGLHVLVEKPMAVTGADCDRMIDAANTANRVLAVGLMRRQLTGHRWLKAALQAGFLGEIRTFRFLEGGPFNWPLKSPDLWSREKSAGGVLLDTGAHTLDQLIWWLGEPELISYQDDNLGGVEADCEMKLRLANGAVGTVSLSRTRKLPGTAVIEGERGRVRVELSTNRITAEPISLLDQDIGGHSGRSFPGQSFNALHRRQMESFLAAVDSAAPPTVDAIEGAKSVRLMEACYAARQPLNLPWLTPASPARAAARSTAASRYVPDASGLAQDSS